jgi:hydroxymethylpyrimidine/phosphomethylpyrimidine kinase
MIPVPVMLTIAGSDPSGGAGIQADLKTASALGVYGASVVTALTAQNTRGVTGIHAVPPAFVVEQYESVMCDLDVRAVKIGMLGSVDVVEAVASMLERRPAPALILDPVMIASSGDRLIPADAERAIHDLLVPLAGLVTPNVPEASALSGVVIEGVDDLAEAGRALLRLGAGAALVKGGHLPGPESSDVLVTAGAARRLVRSRIDTVNTHGTGCTLSAAIASYLVRGLALADAVEAARDYLQRALVAGSRRRVGAGRGPVDHLVAS